MSVLMLLWLVTLPSAAIGALTAGPCFTHTLTTETSPYNFLKSCWTIGALNPFLTTEARTDCNRNFRLCYYSDDAASQLYVTIMPDAYGGNIYSSEMNLGLRYDSSSVTLPQDYRLHHFALLSSTSQAWFRGNTALQRHFAGNPFNYKLLSSGLFFWWRLFPLATYGGTLSSSLRSRKSREAAFSITQNDESEMTVANLTAIHKNFEVLRFTVNKSLNGRKGQAVVLKAQNALKYLTVESTGNRPMIHGHWKNAGSAVPFSAVKLQEMKKYADVFYKAGLISKEPTQQRFLDDKFFCVEPTSSANVVRLKAANADDYYLAVVTSSSGPVLAVTPYLKVASSAVNYNFIIDESDGL